VVGISNEINKDNLHKVRCEASRHLRKNRKRCVEDKIDELPMNSKKKNIGHLYRREASRHLKKIRRNMCKTQLMSSQ
jgi:hypothetical protein